MQKRSLSHQLTAYWHIKKAKNKNKKPTSR